MNLKGKTILVTGGAGFIGSALCHKLYKESNIIALDHFSRGKESNLSGIKDEIEIIKADICNIDTIREPIKRSDIIFHLAALDDRLQCRLDFNRTYNINVNGTLNILSCIDNIEKFIYASSVMVYGETLYLPIDELHPLNGLDSYASSKIISEQLTRSFNYLYNLPYTIVRISNTYGIRQDTTALIPTLILQGLKENKIILNNSKVLRDLLYIDDCVNGLIEIAKRDSTYGETINLGTGIGTTTSEVADILCEKLGIEYSNLNKQLPISSRLVLNITKLKSLTKWKPTINIKEGLISTLNWIKEEYDNK